jgi:hypothetical protein
MKMSDYFPEAFEVPHNNSFEVQDCQWVTFGQGYTSSAEQDNAIEHAVLNHDRLTQENQQLREALAALVETSSMNEADLSQERLEFHEDSEALTNAIKLLSQLEAKDE